ncbi:MAG: acylneuraminate cytidylyltransferase family protein, partial [Patescibacteria group bacterium]
MYKHSIILALIPARGGSKGIPKKNIKLLGGKPLIVWSIEVAKQSRYIDRIIVSTDNEEIAEVARSAGAEVPFLRPAEIAQDLTPDMPVFEHALAWLRENDNFIPEFIVHLRPTGPLRTAKEIDEAIEMLAADP